MATLCITVLAVPVFALLISLPLSKLTVLQEPILLLENVLMVLVPEVHLSAGDFKGQTVVPNSPPSDTSSDLPANVFDYIKSLGEVSPLKKSASPSKNCVLSPVNAPLSPLLPPICLTPAKFNLGKHKLIDDEAVDDGGESDDIDDYDQLDPFINDDSLSDKDFGKVPGLSSQDLFEKFSEVNKKDKAQVISDDRDITASIDHYEAFCAKAISMFQVPLDLDMAAMDDDKFIIA
ncbi:hypothetical protein FA15DRAFT_662207 [Coprinopsis marcescibilis]|uniref:Uncharacterized protein n=1 Tax=Coprinopsis marcescibilis TaxID=230819 RepID=A0A5C3K8K3_COPMA|nr:hypothetical protein FA15DRAFT_662207 [Coprinopsis marcescibilis]